MSPSSPADARQLGALIAKGGTAEVFAWGDRHVLKLYRQGSSPEQVCREAEQTRDVRAAGIAAPAVADTVSVDGRVGVILERVVGPTLLEVLADRPAEVGPLARQFAAIQADLHDRQVPSLPPQRPRLRADVGRALELADDTKAAVTAVLDRLSDGDAVCHGDYHLLNVVMTAAGPVLLDWFNATRGNPLADVARTVMVLKFTMLPRNTDPGVRRAVDAARPAFLAAYWEEYARRRPFETEQLVSWMLPVAAARLAKPISTAEREQLLALLQSHLPR